jgi:hypothetical protein
MKNTILKIAGVKDEKSFYKKHATEADFLKAYPKFALGGKMNIQAMQKFAGGGSVFKDIAAGAYGAGSGVVNTLIPFAEPFTDMGYQALQNAGGSTEDEMREQDSIAGYAKAGASALTMATNPTSISSGINQISKGLGQGISKGNEK